MFWSHFNFFIEPLCAHNNVVTIIKFLNEKNIGAYSISISTHTIDNYNTLRANNTYALIVNKDLLYSKERKYYFNKEKHCFIPAKKKCFESFLW